MNTAGIITCENLRLHCARLLASDPDVTAIAVIEDTFSTPLINDLEARGMRGLQRIPHMNSYRSDGPEGLQVIVRVMDLTLHRKGSVLQKAIQRAAQDLAPYVDRLLLCYGLCGNALREVPDVGIPVYRPLEDGKPVDDCIGLLLGSRDRYYAEQRNVPGTFFMTAEWTLHWRKMCAGRGSDRLMARIFSPYERALLIITPVMTEDRMIGNIKDFTGPLGLRIERCRGTLSIMNSMWDSLKRDGGTEGFHYSQRQDMY